MTSENDDTVADRYNEGKIDLTLLPVEACKQEAKVWMMGEEKYGRYNWKKLWGDKTIDVAMASLLRHAFAILDGEVTDTESGLDHAAHIRCNAAMILEYRKQQKLREGEYDSDGAKIVKRFPDGSYEVAIVHRFMDGTNTFYQRRNRKNVAGK